MAEIRSQTEPAKTEIQTILHDFGLHIQEVEEYIQSSFKDVEILTNLQKEEEEKIKDIYSIKLNSLTFPLDLNLDYYFKKFYDSGVLKSFESRVVIEHFPKFFFSDRVKKMCKLLFLVVFILKFPDCVDDIDMSLLATIRRKLSSTYVKVFAKLPKIKDEIINILIFSVCYITHMLFYMLFPRNIHQFKIRFILDVYHIAIFELNGIYISDYYLQNNFERIFTSKFLDYEQQKSNNPLKKIAKLSTGPKNEKLFLGRKLTYPVIFNHEGGMDFADELINRLKIHKRSPRRHGMATMMNNNNNNNGKNNPSENKIGDFEDAVNAADQKLFKAEAKKITETIAGHQSEEEKEKEEIKKKVIMNMNARKKFNCIQISPAVSQVLDIHSMNLPYKKKKLIHHSIDKLYTQNKDYKEMFEEIYNQRKNIKEKKVNTRPKSISQKSLLNHYGNIKIEYDEKAKKHPKLFCDMEELYEVLKKYDERFTGLASSKQAMEDYKRHNVYKFDEIHKAAEDEYKQREKQVETQKLLQEKEKVHFIEQLAIEEVEHNSRRRETKTIHEEANKTEENVTESSFNPRSISTFFKLPILANKFLQNTSVGKKVFSKSRTKNLSESTAASLLKGTEEEGEEIDYSALRKKVNLNAVIEERGQMKNISDDEEEKSGVNNMGDANLFVDKRREYVAKYAKVIRGNHDENIDELINKIMVKQNMLTKKLISGFKNTKNKNNKGGKKIKINI